MAWQTEIDLQACVGCHACTVACRSEFGLPPGSDRTAVRVVEVGGHQPARRAHHVVRCQQCADAPCARVCPTGAIARRPDGILVIERESCIGCRLCLVACPYDALEMNPISGAAEKCDLCAHRLDQGLLPACAAACPTQAIALRSDAGGEQGQTLRPELGCGPRVRYLGGQSAALDPLAARPPAGGIFAASEQAEPMRQLGGASGALLAQGPGRRPPWDGRAALGIWLRGVAAGVYLVPAALVLGGALPEDDVLWRLVAPAVALVYGLGAAGVLLWELDSPRRLPKARLNLRSDPARGAVALVTLLGLLLLHLVGALAHLSLPLLLTPVGLVLGLAVPFFTARLLWQSRGRRLWASRRQFPRLVCASAASGAAMLLPLASVLSQEALSGLYIEPRLDGEFGIALKTRLKIG